MILMLNPEWIVPKRKVTSYEREYTHLYDEIKALSEKGMLNKNIAARFKMAEFSVNKLLAVPERY